LKGVEHDKVEVPEEIVEDKEELNKQQYKMVDPELDMGMVW